MSTERRRKLFPFLPLLDSMAYSILSSLSRLMQRLETPLQTLVLREAVSALEAMLPSLEAAVIQAEERQWREELARSWLMDLKDAAFDAEDALEELDSNLSMLCPPDSSAPPQTYASSLIGEDEVCGPLTSLAYRIEEIGSRFREILEQVDALQLKGGETDRGWLESDVPPLRDELVNQPEVFGREEDKKNVIESLLSDSPIVALIGAGGVGKSTLARLVLDESRVCEHYPRRGWIRMSKDLDALTLKREVMETLTNMAWRIEFAGKGEWIFQQPNYLENYIKRELGAERFLIVLDDFCEENLDLWETITLQLSHGHVGSRVLIVTRSERLVSVLENTPNAIYRVSNLSEDDSWQLFQNLAFESHLRVIEPNLVEVGKEIVHKCKGLPLSVKMLGVLLQSETRLEMWVSILNSRLWKIDENENDTLLPALLISYYSLPSRLQSCIGYCSLFPKDFLYRKEKLVRLWMAQGFVHPREGKLLEEIGSENFDELLRRGFFLKWYVGDQTFVLHPLIHDLVEHLSGKQCCKQKKMNISCISDSTRHVSFNTGDTLIDVSLGLGCESRRLRTVLILIKSVNSAYKRISRYDFRYDILHLSFSGIMFQTLKCLRTLDFSDTDVEVLPDSVCNLKHLRFLGLNNTRIRWLPEDLCHLCNLQTLELQNCHIISLPRSISYLTNLHHLDLLHANEYIHLHHGIGKLTNLQTLSVFYTGKDAEHYAIKELGNLRNLRGELCITGLHNLDDAADAKEAGLILKEHLKKLTLQWCYPNDDCYRRGVAPKSTEYTCINCKNHEAIEEQQRMEEASGCWASNAEEITGLQDIQHSSSNSGDADDDTWFFNLDIDIETMPEKPKRTREDIIMSQRKIRESQEMMLDNLRPHCNLEELEVTNYHGSKLSSWMGDPAFSKLVSIRLHSCFECEILPPLGQLPLLRHLLMSHLPRVKRVGREFCGSGHGSGFKAFPSLETAEFEGMYEWEEWCGEVEAGEFARLREMSFYGCMRLKRIPDQLKRWL